ncbi:hypothetical protein ACFVTY_36360 [Streptomyces sp. NPDC058067]|uniref:hypothetical protein n=1 Tax=Streptomyces sp. NPDC058067 TaxID=3346324 RepID=UPI0036E0A9DE
MAARNMLVRRVLGRGFGAVGLGVVVVLGAGPAVADGPRLPLPAPEADLAYHGQVAVSAGRVDVAFIPQNHGPSAVGDATVRLRWSAPVAFVPGLPQQCVRAEARTVLCRTGALPADGMGGRIGVSVWLAGVPSEVTVRIDTVWSDGKADRNPQNSRHQVLALDTGDVYYF